MAKPIPLLPPVTSAIFPWSRRWEVSDFIRIVKRTSPLCYSGSSVVKRTREPVCAASVVKRLYVPFVRLRINDRNSVRVSCSSRKQPSIEEVTAAECCFSTPRIIMQR